LPEPGTAFLGFRLLEELGRGTFGRVFLAEQGDLANRYVALKVSADIWAESQTLAQLQHTHIVPINSIHGKDDLQAVCMPYFGATTLADVLREVAGSNALPASGKVFVSTVNDRKASTRHRLSARSARNALVERAAYGPASQPESPRAPKSGQATDTLRILEGLTYVEAILWIGIRLADGLAHAHERGILHRDLKPAIVLLTEDGQPMLLDFNLSADTKLPAAIMGASIGGTLPYMAPEHLQAFLGKRHPVDVRSDLYSLGVILFELLAAKPPFPSYSRPSTDVLECMLADRLCEVPDLCHHNPAVSSAVASIVQHCLEADPARRYQSVEELREDLQRQLNHQPLQYARERSVRERVRKWWRRHPRLTSFTTLGVAAAVILTLLTLGFVARGRALVRKEARDIQATFQDDLRHAQALLCAQDIEPDERDAGIAVCRGALQRYHVLDDPAWQQSAPVRSLGAEEQVRLRQEVEELLLLLTHATTLEARAQREPAQHAEDLQRALQFNTFAESRAGVERPSRALWLQRGELEEALGDIFQARDCRAKAEETPLKSVRDLYLAAHEQTKQGKYREALPLLLEATQKDSQDFPAWFVRGYCHAALAQDAEAVMCFGICLALRPMFQPAWHNRGKSYLKQRLYSRACADFDRAIALQPDLPDAYIDRALAKQVLGRYEEAERDLTQALKLGTGKTRVYFLRAEVRRQAGDPGGARLDLAEGLRRQPNDEQSWLARGLARLEDEPEGALADFDEALRLNPHSIDALQNKAHVLSEHLHRPADALRALDTAVALNPDYVPARAGRGILLARRGDVAAAEADARDALLRDTRPPNLYQVAGIYALNSRRDAAARLRAFELLYSALRSGFGLDLVEEDSDLDPIRKDPEFRRLVEAARALRSGPGAKMQD
jgi:serine/threonine protein kinase/tetratricopeptide (TPR) repeat protein